jgi:hypothetical protein
MACVHSGRDKVFFLDAGNFISCLSSLFSLSFHSLPLPLSCSIFALVIDSSSLMKRPNRDDSSMFGLTTLLSQLQKEYRFSIRSNGTGSSTEVVKGFVKESSDSHPFLSPTLRPTAKARGLPLFDRSSHLVPSLPLNLTFPSPPDRSLPNFL